MKIFPSCFPFSCFQWVIVILQPNSETIPTPCREYAVHSPREFMERGRDEWEETEGWWSKAQHSKQNQEASDSVLFGH